MQATDTSAIQQLIGKAKRRIRWQWALEGATTASILASAAALWVVFLIRVEVVAPSTGVGLLVATLGIIAAGALLKASRRIQDERVARRIDRASNLSDRLSTAIAFTHTAAGESDETQDLMLAAIRDGVRAVPRANVAKATPFSAPPDLRPALGFLAISALAAGLAIPMVDRAPHLYRVEPDHAAAGDEVVLRGKNLMTGVAQPIASLPARSSLGVPSAPAGVSAPVTSPVNRLHGFVPTNARITIGDGKLASPVVLDWSAEQILIQIPDGTPIGATTLTAWIDDDAIGPIAFTVVDRKDPAYHKDGSVTLDPDDRAYLEALLAELKAVAKRDRVPELEDFAKQVEQLLEDAELGKISKEQLLDTFSTAQDKLNKHGEPDPADVNKQLAEMGKELAKDQVTKELGNALQKNDLDKAQQELEKLAEKLENKQLSDKDKDQLAKQLDKVAKQMDQKEQQQDKKQQDQQQKLDEEIRRLEKKKEQAKTEQDKLEAERQLNKKKDELKKLDKDSEDKQQSAQRQALKRLSKDMAKAAENLQKPQKPDDQKQDQEQRDQQASQKLKEAARETGKVDQDQRKQATQKKMSSQMDDLREAMRRAKQKGNKSGQDPFGKQGKNQDFAQRARGQKGQGQAWKPGQGQPGQGQGKGQQGQGQGSGGQGSNGKEWGTGHDDNLTGDATQKSGNTKDDELQGAQGTSGGGTRETILSAAQKGFASQRYKDVYGKYHQIVEEVMRNEKLPSSYKYYVKRYFAKIHPSTEAPPVDAAPQDKSR
ncbi:MAG: hypothetical protein ABIY55_09685 [Kofleriaceae bacterium]